MERVVDVEHGDEVVDALVDDELEVVLALLAARAHGEVAQEVEVGVDEVAAGLGYAVGHVLGLLAACAEKTGHRRLGMDKRSRILVHRNLKRGIILTWCRNLFLSAQKFC